MLKVMMIRYEEISSLELLEKIIQEDLKSMIRDDGEHPLIMKYKVYSEFLGYFAYDNEKVIGIVFVSPFHSKEAYSCTNNFNIYLMKEYRRRGIAKELFNLFQEGLAKKPSIKNLLTTVYEDQNDSVNWLIKNSFLSLGYLDDIDIDSHYGKKVVFFIRKLC